MSQPPASSVPDESAAAAKAVVRREVRAARRRRAAVGHGNDGETAAGRGREATAAQVTALEQTARCVGAYLAAPGEPDPAAAVATWHASGLRVLLPVAGPGRTLDWVEWAPELRVERGRNAPVPEPVGATAADPAALDLVVVPALQVGRDGTRLGQGGGFYDVFLAEHPGLTTVACVFADEVVDQVPSDPWDAVLDAVWTEDGVRRLPL